MPRQALRSTAVSLLLITGLAGIASAQTPEPSEAARSAPADLAPADSAANIAADAPRSGWLYVLPVIAYTPETKLILGASAGRFGIFAGGISREFSGHQQIGQGVGTQTVGTMQK